MKKRKTAILLALALSLTAVFTACGSSKDGSSQAKPEGQSETGDQADATDQTDADGQAGAASDQTSDTAGQPAADKFHIELEEVGRVNRNDGYVADGDALLYYEGDDAKFCDFKGNIVDERPIAGSDYLGWGLYTIALENEEEINRVGLVTVDGEVLIPFDAAIIDFPLSQLNKDVKPRYILAYYGTEQTTNQEESLFYSSDRPFPVTANDDDTFYKGFIRIYDLETRQFVNGLEFDHGNKASFDQVGDNLLVDVDSPRVVYSPDGKAVYTEQGSLFINRNYMVDTIDGQYVIMDANGNPLYSSDVRPRPLGNNSDYFTQRDGDITTAINAKGEPVLNGEWKYISAESKDRFCVQNDDDSYLVSADNTIIYASPSSFQIGPLGFIVTDNEQNITVVTPGNRIIKDLQNGAYDLIYTKDDGASYLILNTGEFASVGDNFFHAVSEGLICLGNAEHKYALIDSFTGEKLYDFVYDTINPVDSIKPDYIYCEDGDEIIIYKVNIVPEY